MIININSQSPIAAQPILQNSTPIQRDAVAEDDAVKVTISESAMIEAIQSQVITQGDAYYLYSAAQNLGTGNLEKLFDFALNMEPNGRSILFTALSEADDDASDLLNVALGLKGDELTYFLTAAVQSGETIPDLIEVTSKLSGDVLVGFLGATAELDEKSLKNFVKIAKNAEDNIVRFIEFTTELSVSDQGHFLAAAINAEDLGSFITHVENTNEETRSDFLLAASKAGESLPQLLNATTRLNAEDLQSLFALATSFNAEDYENYLAAAGHTSFQDEGLRELALYFQGEDRTSFLKVAAKAGGEVHRFVGFVGPHKYNLNFLSKVFSVAQRVGEKVGDLIKAAQSAGEGKFWEFTADLSTVDLLNLLETARNAPDNFREVLNTTKALSGKNRSYFLFSVLKAGDQLERLLKLTNETTKNDQARFLFAAANTENEEELSILMSDSWRLSQNERSTYLSKAASEVLLKEQQPSGSKYVYLTNFLEKDELNSFLSATQNLRSDEDVGELLSQADKVSDRSSFLEIAAKSGKEIHHLLNLTEILTDQEQDEFYRIAVPLGEKNLQNFILAAKDAGEHIGDVVRLTHKLNGLEKDRFLMAAANAKDYLEKLIRITDKLTGLNRSLFLTVAADAGLYLKPFLKYMDKSLKDEFNSYKGACSEVGFRLDSLLVSKKEVTDSGVITKYSLQGTRPEEFTNFLDSAVFVGRKYLGELMRLPSE